MTAAKMGRTADERATVRTRPTNNQLLYGFPALLCFCLRVMWSRYKAYFRWQHYPVPSSPIYKVNETDACASVTAAFLQVCLDNAMRNCARCEMNIGYEYSSRSRSFALPHAKKRP